VDGRGRPAVDTDGNIWVTAGNGSVTSSSQAYDDSDSVLELSPSLTLEQYFAPSSWPSDNARDLDFSTGVALLSDGLVVAASKSRSVFLLNGSSLGGIGGQQAQLDDACGTVIDGGLAVEGSTVYLPCLSGPIAVQATDSPAGLHLLWSSSVGGGRPSWRVDSSGPSAQTASSTASTRLPAISRIKRPSVLRRTTSQPPPWRWSLAGTFVEPRRGLSHVGRSRTRSHDDYVTTVHNDAIDDGAGAGATAGWDKPMDNRGRHRRRHRRPRCFDLVHPAASRPGRRPLTCSASGQQDLEDRAHAGHDQRDGHDDGHHLYQRPVDRLPVADVRELVEHGAVGVRPRRFPGGRSSSGRGSRVAT